MADQIKLSFALLLLLGGVGAFYFYAEQTTLVRVFGLLVVVAVAIGIAMQTQKGRDLGVFFLESRTEIRKVVWPTRKETVQTTIIVLLVVMLVAIFLWLLDMFLLWAVRLLTTPGG